MIFWNPISRYLLKIFLTVIRGYLRSEWRISRKDTNTGEDKRTCRAVSTFICLRRSCKSSRSRKINWILVQRGIVQSANERREFFSERRPLRKRRRLQIAGRQIPTSLIYARLFSPPRNPLKMEIDNYRSVIVAPHYSDREAQEFLFQAIALRKAPLASEKIKFDLAKRCNNISERIDTVPGIS